MAVMWTSECPVTAASNCIAIRTEARTGQGRPQAARRGRPSYQPLFSPTTRPLPSHVGERGRLSWATAGTERTQNRQASTHTPPRLRTRPTRDLGRAVSGHEAALVHLASPLDVGREGTRAHRGQENRGQPAGGGPAPQAPGPASPAGRGAVRGRCCPHERHTGAHVRPRGCVGGGAVGRWLGHQSRAGEPRRARGRRRGARERVGRRGRAGRYAGAGGGGTGASTAAAWGVL
jgi:hypothetical protein